MKIQALFAVLIVLTSCTTNHVNEKPISSRNSIDSAQIVEYYTRATLFADSNQYYREKALELAIKNGSTNCKATRLFLEGKAYLYVGKLDSVDSIANEGLNLHYQANEKGFRGKFYNLKGNTNGYRRNLYASLEYYVKAERIFRSVNDLSSLAGIYNNIANNYFSLKDYNTALEYASKAYQLLGNVQEDRIKANILSTYAITLNKTKQPKKALVIEAKADSIANSTDDVLAKLAATIGYAEIYKTDKQFDSAKLYYNQCIRLSRKSGVKHFELMGQMGLLSIYDEQNDFQKIIANSDTILLLAKELNNLDVAHTSKRIIGRAYAEKGDYKKGFIFLNESYNLYSETAGVENQKNINELRLKYESEKKAKKILKQRYQLAKQQKEIGEKQTFIGMLLLLLLIALLVLFFVRKLARNKQAILVLQANQKIAESMIQGEEKERTRIAFEIHDGIAATVAGISYKLGADGDKKEVIELLKGLQEDSRKIAHNLMPIDFDKVGLIEAVELFSKKMSTPLTEIIILSHPMNLKFSTTKSHLIYRVLQELIGNALKHARCNSIFVKFELLNNELIIQVEDDGLGMTKSQIESGLKSVKERISDLRGKVTVQSSENRGTTVKIQLEA
ncbi:ATP-binding protein [Fluviicola taffensis]|uniref:tetratricopeptide repeat-containing sensor histidine kinase n=1 Tax=Fluviicola taffensis TaxID=191579 RepID=UPI003137D357